MKKILYIHHATGWGGPSKSLIKLVKSLDPSKYEAEVLLLKNSKIADILSENGIHYKVAESIFYKKYYGFFPHSEAGYIKWFHIFSFLKLSVFWILSRYIFARKELALHKFDIAHLNSSVLTDWLAPAKEKGRVVMHIREPFRKGKVDILHNFFKSEIVKFADQIIAISEDNFRRINIPTKTEVIYNYSEIPTHLPSDKSYLSKSVLYLGGSSTSKGFFTLVDTLDYLDKDVLVYFGGHYAERIKSQNIIFKIFFYFFTNDRKREIAMRKIKNHPNVKIINLIHNVQDYLDEVCCLISPFLLPHFSRPIIEAHLHSKAVIGSDVEGMDELIIHKKNGLIVAKNNPKELATAINELTSNPKSAKLMGVEGYRMAIEKFSPKNIKLFEQVYDKL